MSVETQNVVPSRPYELFLTYAVPTINFLGDLAQKASVIALKILAGVMVVSGLGVIANAIGIFPPALAFLLSPFLILPVILLAGSIGVGVGLANKMIEIMESKKL